MVLGLLERGRRAALLALAGLALRVAPAPAQADRVYVANQENASVTVIDARSGTALRTVDLTALGFSANCKPHHVAVEPDGRFWYVTLITDGRVLKFTHEDSLVGEARLEVPGMIALDPHGDRMVVGRSMSAVSPPPRLAVLHRSTMRIEEEIELPFPRPHAVALDPGGTWAYTASLAENRMAAVNLVSGEVRVHALEGPLHTVVQFAVSPDGRWLVASGQLSGRFLVFDRADPAAPRLIRGLEVGASPWDPVFAPDGRSVWLANLDANTVTVVDVASWAVTAVIRDERLAQPNGLALSPDGRWAFVANRNQHGPAHLHEGSPQAGVGFVAVMDAPGRRIERILPAGRYAAGVGAPGPPPPPPR